MVGYTHWAYVTEFVDCKLVNTDCPGIEKTGKRIYTPPYRQEITDPKNCNYNEEPAPFPKTVCHEWIKANGHELVATVKMRTD